MKRFFLLLPILVLAGGWVTSCGSDAPTREEYIAEADAVCQEADADIEAVGREQFGTQPPNRQELARFAEEEVIPNIETQLAELRELDPPEGDEEQLTEIYDTLQQGVEDFKADPDLDNPPEAIAEANRLAEDYGFEVCGNEN